MILSGGILSVRCCNALLIVILSCSQLGAQTLDELARKAAQEGVVNFYGTLAQIKIRPAKIYPIGTEEIKDWKKYEKIWKETFNLR